jgi:site-specific DNA-cytosine methylase
MFVPGVAYSMATKQISQNIGIDIACPLCASDYKEPQVVMPGEAYNIREDSAKGNMSITPTDIHVCLQAQRSSDNSQHANTFILDPLQKTAGTLTPGAHPGSYNGQDAYSDLLIAEESPIGFNHLQDPVCMDERMPCIGAEGQAVVDNRNGTESTSVSPTLQSKPGGGFSPNCTPSVRMGMSVRRLTPLECERLQGFPDGWTDLPGSTDSSRFRALGNSFALPQAYFVISGCVDAIRRMREDGQ